MKKVIAILAVVVAVAALSAGCATVSSPSAQQDQGNYNAAPSEPAANSITLQQFRDLPLGMSIQNVIDSFGPAADRQESYMAGLGTDVELYYNDVNDTSGISSYQLAFENGTLTSKNQY